MFEMPKAGHWFSLNMFYIFLVISFFLYIDRNFEGLKSRKGYYLFFPPFLFFLGEVAGIMALLTVLSYLVLSGPKKNFILIKRASGLFFLSLIISKVLFAERGSEYSLSSQLIYVLTHINEVLVFAKYALLQACINYNDTKNTFSWFSEFRKLSRFFSFYITFALSLWLNIRVKSMAIYIFPLLLTLFSLVSMFGILVIRLPEFGPEVILGGRFVRLCQMMVFGCHHYLYRIHL